MSLNLVNVLINNQVINKFGEQTVILSYHTKYLPVMQQPAHNVFTSCTCVVINYGINHPQILSS